MQRGANQNVVRNAATHQKCNFIIINCKYVNPDRFWKMSNSHLKIFFSLVCKSTKCDFSVCQGQWHGYNFAHLGKRWEGHNLEHRRRDLAHGQGHGKVSKESYPASGRLQWVHLLHGGRYGTSGLWYQVNQKFWMVSPEKVVSKYIFELFQVRQNSHQYLLWQTHANELDDVWLERGGNRF